MITFKCDSCKHSLRVPDSCAGKKGKCPKCSAILRIPQEDLTDISYSLTKELHLKIPPAPVSKPNIPDQTRQNTEYNLNKNNKDHEKRKYPWLIDILLYPTSMPGLINLCIFWFLPILLGIMTLIPLIGIICWLMSILTWIYMVYYLTTCVHSSIAGNTRAPDSINDRPDILSALVQLLMIVGVIFMVFSPGLITLIITHKITTLFRILTYTSIFFLPMALLAAIFFDSTTGFNPFIWISSILSTLIPYTGLVILFYILYGVLWYIRDINSIIIIGPILYLNMVLAHILGRFYYNNEDRLRWGA
jgi:hypothetical protein